MMHGQKNIKLLFSVWRHVSAAHAAIFRPA